MKERMRAASVWSAWALSSAVAVGSIFVSALPARPALIVRFVNGREIAARHYWCAPPWLMFARSEGTVGVPRSFVANIELTNEIGGRELTVNAPCGLSPCDPSVRLSAAMTSKEDLYDRAVDLVADGKLDEAIEAYKQALTCDPQFADAVHGIAMAYADKGMFDQAVEYGRRLVELTPDDTLAHTSLSMFYQRKGMIAEAEAEGAKARVLDWKRQLAEQEKGGGGS